MKRLFFFICFGIMLMAGILAPRHAARAVTSTIIDSSITSNNNSNNGTAFTNVFISSSTGYVFFRDSTNFCVYSKTTNGGATWNAAVTVSPNANCIRVAVWYDRWTPGNTTGTIIHIATIETTHDDLWYDRLDTGAGDTLSTAIDISSSTTVSGSYTAGATVDAMTEGTNGTLYAGLYNTGGSFVLQCSSSCTATTSWSLAGPQTTWNPGANDWMILNPLPSGNIINIRFALASSTLYSKVWHNSSSSWDTNWTTIDNNCAPNTTYDGHFGTAVNGNSNAIYMASACQIATLNNSANPEIKTWTYTPASSTWVRDTDVETSSTLGITGVKIGLDKNTGNIYVVYSGRTTKNQSATANVYYKISTSTSMSSWGAIQGPINATSGNIYGARIDGMSLTRLYSTWVNVTDGTLNGQTIAVFSPTTYTQAAYTFFQNLNGTQVGTPFDTENASSIIPLAGQPFRLRMLVNVGGAGTDIDGQYFKLQYATSSNGACSTSFSDGLSYGDVGTATSSAISYYNNSSPANGAALTANGQDPTDGTNVIVNQTYVEQNNFSNDIAKIFGTQDGKWDFSLVNNSASTGQNFCFRIVKNDGTLLDTYSVMPSAQVDAAPTISNLSLNGGHSITLIEGTTTDIQATGTISDANGFSDIYSIMGVMYRTSLGPSCTPDNNDCYQASSANCNVSGCSGTSCIATCDYNVWYFAQPTDSGTPWVGDSWSTLMQASDTVYSGVTATSSGVSLLSLLAFETTSTINYGSFTAGQSMSSLTATSVIRATGNVSMNVNIYGTNMTNGAQSIAVGQQRFATSSLSYTSGTTLLVNPGSTVLIDLPKPSSTTVTPSSTFYWGIALPATQPTGNFTGHNTFVGVLNTSTWP